jgi:NAD(P)-dependent dehydrogenase (short-subunit alcohol dehydrogenase family)
MRRAHSIAAAAAAAAAAHRVSLRLRALELDGRVALVTGGSRGLGFAIARELVAAGAQVAVCARDEAGLERAREALGGRVLAVPCDVGDRAQVDALVSRVEAELGPVELLVCNAGVISVGPLGTQDVAEFELALATQLWGLVNCSLAVLPGMRERGEGRIANVTSVGGKISVPWLLPYCTSKFAAVGFSEGLRADLAGSGVRVTTVVPGLMRTGSYLAAFFRGDRPEREYALFAPLSATPVTTVGARRAARRIVTALRRGEPEVTIGLHAKLAARAAGAAPGLTAGLLGVTSRLLPEIRGTGRRRGSEVDSPLDRSPLLAFGRRAAADLNQQKTHPQ